MDDGSKLNNGIKLGTCGLTKKECLYLVKSLHIKFGIKSTIHNVGKSKDGLRNHYAIYI